jgi:hypothetical protein
MQHTKDLRVIVMLALVVALAMVTGAQAQQGAVDETLGRPAPVGGPASGGPVPPGGTEALLDDFNAYRLAHQRHRDRKSKKRGVSPHRYSPANS